MLKNAIWLFVLSSVILFSFLPSYTQMQDLKKKNIDYKAQILELKQKNAQLVDERNRLEHDPVYLEKVAREKMGLIKEGEVIYRLVPETPAVKK